MPSKVETKVVRVPEPYVVKVPQGGPIVPTKGRYAGLKGAAAKFGELAKRGMTAARKLAAEDKAMLWEFGTAGVVGYLDGQGSLSKMPHITTVGPIGTLAGALIIGGRYLKSEAMRTIGRACGVIAIADMARTKGRESASGSAASGSGGGTVP